MEMIDRYIYAVTQRLPQAQRTDIADELRGLIEDMLEERIGSGSVTDTDIEGVLLEIGSPRELADKYRGSKKFLIGPDIFDTYLLVLKVVLLVIGGLIGIGFIIQTALNPVAILDHFIEMVISLVAALPTAFGWTTLSFALGEQFGGTNQKDIAGEWKPADLPPIPDEKRRIKRSDSIAGIIFYVILFVVIFSDYFGVWVFNDTFHGVIPFLNEQTYHSSMLFIILIIGLGILKECMKLIIGKWTYQLATFTTVASAISIAATLYIINTSKFWNPSFMKELVDAGVIIIGTEAYEIVSTLWTQIPFWTLVFLIIGFVWDAIDGYRKARKK